MLFITIVPFIEFLLSVMLKVAFRTVPITIVVSFIVPFMTGGVISVKFIRNLPDVEVLFSFPSASLHPIERLNSPRGPVEFDAFNVSV